MRFNKLNLKAQALHWLGWQATTPQRIKGSGLHPAGNVQIFVEDLPHLPAHLLKQDAVDNATGHGNKQPTTSKVHHKRKEKKRKEKKRKTFGCLLPGVIANKSCQVQMAEAARHASNVSPAIPSTTETNAKCLQASEGPMHAGHFERCNVLCQESCVLGSRMDRAGSRFKDSFHSRLSLSLFERALAIFKCAGPMLPACSCLQKGTAWTAHSVRCQGQMLWADQNLRCVPQALHNLLAGEVFRINILAKTGDGGCFAIETE